MIITIGLLKGSLNFSGKFLIVMHTVGKEKEMIDVDQNLRAVFSKDQLRSCKIEKTDFPKLCQNKGLGELVLKI